jgi:hypothetical protein
MFPIYGRTMYARNCPATTTKSLEDRDVLVVLYSFTDPFQTHGRHDGVNAYLSARIK